MGRDLKTMSSNEIREYVRELEDKTNNVNKSSEDLECMGFFEIEDYVADLEKELAFRKQG